jgi:tetratricopeptide (TPR) repeat protein
MPAELEPLEPPDSHHLSAAMGWLGLKNWQEAEEELEKIAPAFRSHPSVLTVRFEVYSQAGGKWDKANEIARALIQILPEESQFWIWHAYSARRMPGGGIPQAREILGKAQQLIPEEPLIPYNLGCYECQLGHLEKAWTWLEKAFAIGDATFKTMALEDADLEPLWGKIKDI